MKTEIKIENISKSFDTQQVLDHITMDFQRGYIHLLNGNNGCGKSTMLKIMYGLMIPDEGTVYWNAKDIEKCRNEYLNHIGIVTADDLLCIINYPHMRICITLAESKTFQRKNSTSALFLY